MTLGFVTCCIAFALSLPLVASAEPPWLEFEGSEGPGKGKHIVLISGDEEYRSEEALPQLAKILSRQHGFDTTVLFAIDPATGYVDPYDSTNIPGLERLGDADLMIIAARMRQLPDDQMNHIDTFLRRGGSVVGMRTATHAFGSVWGLLFGEGDDPATPYAHYFSAYDGAKIAWHGGFGRRVLGETFVGHHGDHGHESTRGVLADGARQHPIARGLADVDIWGPSDVYAVRLPLPASAVPIVLGQVVLRDGPHDDADRLLGMRPTDRRLAPEKNDPMLPIAWTNRYQIPDGERGRAFTTTMGAATDLLSEGVRRLILNGAYWAIGLEVPEAGASAALEGDYQPTAFGFDYNFLGLLSGGVLGPTSSFPDRKRVPRDYAE